MKLFTKFLLSIISVTIIVLAAALTVQTYLIQRAQNEAASTTLFEQSTAIRSLIENNLSSLDFYPNLRRFSLSKKASAILINPNSPVDNVMYFYDDEYEEEVLSYEELFMPYVARGEMLNKYLPSEYDRLSYVILYGRPMPDGTYLLLSCRTVTLQGVIFNNRAQYSLILVLSLATSTVFAYVLAKNISNPLNSIVEASKQIAKGNFEVDINTKSSDELANVAKSINSMSKQLQKASKFKDEIISNVSHNLKTPISAILTYCELLETCDLPKEKQQEFIKIIEDRARKLEDMVKSLIMLSKIETGTEDIKLADFDLCDLAEDCVESFEIILENKGVELKLDCPETEIYIKTDYDKLSTILSNLVSNAINHTPENGTVTISIVPMESRIKMVVADTGEGICAEDLPYIWDRFYKSSTSNFNKERGTGLGLNIVKRLFDLLEFQYSLTSKEDLGTQVTFYINYNFEKRIEYGDFI